MGARVWYRSHHGQSHRRGRRGDLELGRRRSLRRGALAGSLAGKAVPASRLEVRQTESAPDALIGEGCPAEGETNCTARRLVEARLLLRYTGRRRRRIYYTITTQKEYKTLQHPIAGGGGGGGGANLSTENA